MLLSFLHVSDVQYRIKNENEMFHFFVSPCHENEMFHFFVSPCIVSHLSASVLQYVTIYCRNLLSVGFVY